MIRFVIKENCKLSLKLNFNHSKYNSSPNIYFLPFPLFLLQITLEYTSIFHSKYYRTSLVNDIYLSNIFFPVCVKGIILP